MHTMDWIMTLCKDPSCLVWYNVSRYKQYQPSSIQKDSVDIRETLILTNSKDHEYLRQLYLSWAPENQNIIAKCVSCPVNIN